MPKDSSDILMNSWRRKTRQQYDIYLKRYNAFCKQHDINPLLPVDTTVIKFLTTMFHEGYGYSSLNTARAAISCINGIGSSPLVCKFIRGVFNLRPPRPRYTTIWDVSVMLNYLRSISPASRLNLLTLSAKLVTLCALVTGHRCQTLHALNINDLHLSSFRAVFHIEALLKTNSPRNPTTVVSFSPFREDRRICVYTYLKHYLKRTKAIRSSNQLFVSTQSPHSAVTKDTIAWWIKLIMTKAGIDTNVFKAHSTRAAASSAASRTVDITHVLCTADWRSEKTFAKFYHKPIVNDSMDAKSKFATSVLRSKAASL